MHLRLVTTAANLFPVWAPLTAVPSAFSGVCHSSIGSLLAAVWRMRWNLPRRPGF